MGVKTPVLTALHGLTEVFAWLRFTLIYSALVCQDWSLDPHALALHRRRNHEVASVRPCRARGFGNLAPIRDCTLAYKKGTGTECVNTTHPVPDFFQM